MCWLVADRQQGLGLSRTQVFPRILTRLATLGPRGSETKEEQKYFHVSAQVMGQIPEISLVNPVSVEYLNKPDPVLLCALLFLKEQWKELN